MYKLFLILIFTCVWSTIQGANILALFSSLSYADHQVYRGYVSLLAQRGHSVAVMTPYPGQFSPQDLEHVFEIDVGDASTEFWEEFKRLYTNVEDYYPRMKMNNEFAVKLAIAQLKSKQMQAWLINPNVKFDLIIAEAEIPLFYALADKYKAPLIAFTTSTGTIPMYESKGNPNHPILYPDVNSLNYRNLSVWQKYTEMSRYVNTKLEYYNNYLPLCQVAAEKILGLKKNILELEYGVDMLFVTGNPMLIGNRPTVPAIVYVDGLHLRPGYSLPDDLKNVLDNSQKGAIYFSLGALQESEQLSRSMLQVIADSFREVPYTVLWKLGNSSVVDLPPNVVTQSWFPQQEVLSHPNVKAFITHGGPRSLEEAIFYGVPIIGLPLVKSRKVFMAEITRFGAGEILDPYYLMKKSFADTIIKVASNDEYRKSITNLKTLKEDRLSSPAQDAVYWTEYVVRHQGAQHLRSPAVGVYFYQYFMLDIIGLLFLFILTLVSVLFVTVRYIVRRVKKRMSGRSEEVKFKAL